jgi:uncharacterized protein YjbJ (UPF0337 family)
LHFVVATTQLSCLTTTTFLEETGVDPMSGKADEIKGRAKEAAGAIADDDALRQEGKVDQAAGKTKQVVEKVVDKAKKAVRGE